MPIQAIDEESDRVETTLQEQENKKTMTETEKENKKWLRRYERNMCPADLYDDNSYVLENRVAPI